MCSAQLVLGASWHNAQLHNTQLDHQRHGTLHAVQHPSAKLTLVPVTSHRMHSYPELHVVCQELRLITHVSSSVPASSQGF